MTQQEIAQIVTLARRAPLANMAEAEAASVLLQKLAAYFAPKKEETQNETAKSDR